MIVTRSRLFGLVVVISLLGISRNNVLSQSDAALDPCSGGTLYYIAYPDTVTNIQDARFADSKPEEFFLYIYSPVDQKIKVGRADGALTSKSLIGGNILEFDTKEVTVPLISTRNRPQSNVLKIESESPIVVYAYMATRFGCAAFTPIPVDSWGTEYYAATWEAEFARDIYPSGEGGPPPDTKPPAPAQILVVAAYDNTRVTIRPTDALVECSDCESLTLDAGEAYLVQSAVDTSANAEPQFDIAGSYVTSNKPIGVVSGNTRLWHEPFADGFLGANSYKDLVAEWLAPVDQHGTEFIFMPTWDDLRQRPNADPVRSKEYVRVYATTNELTEVSLLDRLGNLIPGQSTNIKNGKFSHEQFGDLEQAVPFLTTLPGQAYQSPRSVTKFNGTTGSGNYIGAAFVSWSTYMVEMVPREQWTSFAPFKAPSYPSDMKHYLNVVTERDNQSKVYVQQGTSSRQSFPFRDTVSGTGLIWGQMSINPGVNYIIEGDDGTRFGGFIYGNWEGYELYRPGSAKDSEKDIVTSGQGHPSEYEEETAMMYGYPLAPSRCKLTDADQYDVKVEQHCGKMIITIEAQNQNPSGIKFIRLVEDNDVTFNTRLEFVEPGSALELREKNVAKAVVCLAAINSQEDAKGVVEFKDNTREGKIIPVSFTYEGERIDSDPEGIDFGLLRPNIPAGEEPLTLINPLAKDVKIKGLDVVFGDQEFEIVRTEPTFDWTGAEEITLKSGGLLKVWVDITPKEEDRIYRDSLRVALECAEITLPLYAITGEPCLFVSDLDFGTLAPNESKTLPLEICNIGTGEITFYDPWLTWITTNFDVTQDQIERLKNTRLGPVDGSGKPSCVTIMVAFSSSSTGLFRDEAHFHTSASARDGNGCRDVSRWTARVTLPGPQISSYHWGERWLSSRNPCTKNTTEQYEWDIQITNDGDEPFVIDHIAIVDDLEGVFLRSSTLGTQLREHL